MPSVILIFTDVDECKLYNCSTDGTCCSGHGTCSNTFGNWTCLCSPGYVTSYHSNSNISCDGEGCFFVVVSFSFVITCIICLSPCR